LGVEKKVGVGQSVAKYNCKGGTNSNLLQHRTVTTVTIIYCIFNKELEKKSLKVPHTKER
jgi:hypothetical protein